MGGEEIMAWLLAPAYAAAGWLSSKKKRNVLPEILTPREMIPNE